MLDAHPEHQEPAEPLSKHRTGLKKGLLEKDRSLPSRLSKAPELLLLLLLQSPLFLGLPSDAEQKGIIKHPRH